MPSLYPKFDPPGLLPDLSRVPGLLEEWNQALSLWFDQTIKSEEKRFKEHHAQPLVQYFNPVKAAPKGALVEQAITWNAFPKELLRKHSTEEAIRAADRLDALSSYFGLPGDSYNQPKYRPQNEYCEWHVFRDPATGNIRKIAFTSEPPEYYWALWGGSETGATFHGDPNTVLDLYRQYVSPEVEIKDLIASEDMPQVQVRKGGYNPYNKWNITHGIMHLASPPNSLMAEIQLGGDASIARKSLSGRLLVEPDALIGATNYGGPDRNSDPTIGSTVNALVRLGAMITLANPVGLYMDHIDLSGWEAPDGGPVTDLVRIVRGLPGMIERLEVEVPSERGFSISDLRIGGASVLYGGQIAQCITVKLTGVAILAGLKPTAVGPDARAIIDRNNATSFLGRALKLSKPNDPGTVNALVDQGEGPTAPSTSPAGKTMGPTSRTSEVFELPRRR